VTAVMEGFGYSEWSAVIAASIEFSNVFLDQHHSQFRLRADSGNVRDVHGDLHSRNIFLANPPIIFDCIEFKDSYRQIDVWYEVAFLCMDMEFFGQKTLSEVFFEEYTAIHKEVVEKTDTQIFVYYKMLRANIRAKVLALQASPDGNGTSGAENIADSVRYLQLMRDYLEELHRI
jgi:aminoglycoside phosphotransferase family enzyme